MFQLFITCVFLYTLEELSVSGMTNDKTANLHNIHVKELDSDSGFLAEFTALKNIVYKQGLEISGLRESAAKSEERMNEQAQLIEVLRNNNAELNIAVGRHAETIRDMEEEIKGLKMERNILLKEMIKLERFIQRPNDVYKGEDYKVDQMNNITQQSNRRETKEKMDKYKFLNDNVAMDDRETSSDEDNNKLTTTVTGNSGAYPNSEPWVHRRSATVNQIAFSAYLDHDVGPLTSGYIVKCNRILLNLGNHYNAHTGAFTVPQSGIYLLTFFINGYGPNHITFVKLVVDDRLIVAAVSNVSTYDKMGGNTAIVELTAGESVWLEVFSTTNGNLQTDGTYRYVTFSGVLLF